MAKMNSSLKDILATHRLSKEDLSQVCLKEHRDELAKTITDWKAVGVALEFTQEDLDMINTGFPSEEQKKTGVLFQWSMRDKKEATYLRLAKFLFTGGLLNLLDELCRIINFSKAISIPTTAITSTATTDESLSVESMDQHAESRHQGAIVKHQSENHASGAETSLQPVLKSETTGTTSVTLNENDIVKLMRLLQNHSYIWNPIGLSLGFTLPEINTILAMQKLFVGAPVSYLQELLSQWVQWPTTYHPNHPTLEALCAALRGPLVGLGSLAEEVEKDMKKSTSGVILIDQYIRNDTVAGKIEQLEKQFQNLHKSIREELVKKDGMNVNELLQSLTLLPTKLRNEYQAQIMEKLPTLRKEENISELFLLLNPLFSFIDFALLEYIIEQFGSATLKQKMQFYSREIQNFMNQTTIQQLIDYWPCNEESTPNISRMIAKIEKDPRQCKLSELDALRKKICISMRLSDIICAIVCVSSSQSFIVVWRLPLILAQNAIESMRKIDKKFFKIESIDSISIDNEQVYPSTSKLPKLSTKAMAIDQEPNADSDEKHTLLKTQDQLESFATMRCNEDIKKFAVSGVLSGKELGKGSWGSVQEIEVEGIICAGKMFNETLFTQETAAEVTSKYVNVCRVLSNLCHPNIVQFVGLYFFQNRSLPMVVTQKLEGDLHGLLETVANIPMVLKQSLLEDVARGLHYLHSFNPAITHGTLTARNVLYTSSLDAKIADISDTQLVTFQSEQEVQTLSLSDETLSYLPSDTTYQCSPELDIFSFGNLAIFVLSQIFPLKVDQQYYSKAQHRRMSQSEIEPRKLYIQHVERLLPDHSLIKIIKKCLHGNPKNRPTTNQLLATMEEMKATMEGTSISKVAAARQVLAAKDFADLEHQLKETTIEHHMTLQKLGSKDKEIEDIMQSKDREMEELVISKNEKIKVLTEIIASRNRENEELLESKENELKELTESKDREIIQIRELLESKDKEIKDLRDSKEEKIEELSTSTNLEPKPMVPEGILNRAVQLQSATAAGPSKQGGQTKDIGLTLLCGYYATPRDEPTSNGNTHDWTAFVRERDGKDIRQVVKKVTFQLHESFQNPTRVVKDPPYEVSESGRGSFKLPVEIHFSNHDVAKFKYKLQLYNTSHVSMCLSEVFTFQNPSKNFREKLIRAGGRPYMGLSTSPKSKPRKRTSESASAQPKSEKKMRLETAESAGKQQPSSSRHEEKNTPVSSNSSSDESDYDSEWRPSQAGYKI